MIRKIKTNLKNLKNKESSLMDFVLETKGRAKISDLSCFSRSDQRKINRNKDKEDGLNFKVEEINGKRRDSEKLQIKKEFSEDKENKPITNENKRGLGLNLQNSNVKNTIKDYFEPLKSSCNSLKPKKVSKIEFFDEYNKKFVRMNKFEEKDLPFTQSKILPKVKLMKVDNDVMTEEEQVEDAFKMMRDNLKETIKLINENKDYLNKNLSRKIKFEK